MPNQIIHRRNFLTLGGITYSFNMTDHLNPQFNEDQILTNICKMISTAYKADFPIWARLLAGHRIILITPQDELYRYLDEDAQRKYFNFLIFKKDGRNSITVTHFGPFGSKKEDEFKDNLDKTDHALAVLKKALAWLKSPENSMSAEKKKEGIKEIQKKVIANFWAILNAVQLELQELLQKVYIRAGNKEAADKLKGSFLINLTASSCKLLIKEVTATSAKIATKAAVKTTAKISSKGASNILKSVKISSKGASKIVMKSAPIIATKAGAKTAAKISSKGASKSVVKSVPILGFAVGTVFGAWRLLQGDWAGAGLEVASGAASCVPGGGTVASLAIDAALVAKDVYKAKCEDDKRVEKLKLEMKKVENEFNDLYAKYDKANEEYQFAKEVLEDPGFTMEKLEHEIKMLNVVSSGLHNMTKQRPSIVLGNLCIVLLCCFLVLFLFYYCRSF